MLKLTGGIFIISAALLYGFILTDKRRQRLSYIENMILALEKFKSLISLSKVPVFEAARLCGIKMDSAVTEEDKKELERFFLGLDSETEEAITENADTFLSRLLREEGPEKEKYLKEMRLIRGGSIALGILLFIILL